MDIREHARAEHAVKTAMAETQTAEKPKDAKHSCELCRTLGDVVRALDPEKYRYGPECEVGLAFQAALELHKERADKVEDAILHPDR